MVTRRGDPFRAPLIRNILLTVNEILGELQDMADAYEVRNIANHVLKLQSFKFWSGSSKSSNHHYGLNGLIRHTHEVINLCLNNNVYFDMNLNKGVDERKLFLAALFHDVGKIWDYAPVDKSYIEWKAVEHKDKVHHITRSALEWYNAKDGFDPEDEVLHSILAHHGMKEYGSPVLPSTKLAWLLHLCDSLSAQMDMNPN